MGAIKYILTFVAGLAIGTTATALYMRKKYAETIDDEVERQTKDMVTELVDLKRSLKNKLDLKHNTDFRPDGTKKCDSYEDVVEKLGYYPEDDFDDGEDDDDYNGLDFDGDYPEMDVNCTTEPYGINAEEFSELLDAGYTYTQWTIYNGRLDVQVICDERDEMVDPDVQHSTVGKGIYTIGEHAPDVAYVRNDRLRCAIEIIRDNRSYEEVLEAKPYLKI